MPIGSRLKHSVYLDSKFSLFYMMITQFIVLSLVTIAVIFKDKPITNLNIENALILLGICTLFFFIPISPVLIHLYFVKERKARQLLLLENRVKNSNAPKLVKCKFEKKTGSIMDLEAQLIYLCQSSDNQTYRVFYGKYIPNEFQANLYEIYDEKAWVNKKRLFIVPTNS